MKEVKSYFDRYKSNFIKWKNCMQVLWNNISKEKWIVEFTKAQMEAQIMYEENKEILGKLNDCLNSLDDELAESFYTEVMTMYFEDYNDCDLLFNFARRLITYYEKKEDIVKLVDLYCVCQNQLFYIYNPEIFDKEFDMSYVKKGMSFIKYYKDLPESSRYRILIMYYTFIVRLLDYGAITLKDSLDKFDELMSFCEKKEIKKLDKDSDRIHNLIEYTKSAFAIGVIKLDNTSLETQERFYNFICNSFSDHFSKIESEYELSPEEYACYEYKSYFEKKYDVNIVFDNYLDYFVYKYKIISNQSIVEIDDIMQCINSIGIISKLCKFVTKGEKIDKAPTILTDFAEGRWIKGDFDNMFMINDMLARVCMFLIAYDIPGLDKDKCIKQLIIQRNLNHYVKAELIAEISIALYREVSANNLDFFKNNNIVPKSQWKDYLYYASLFHDIGCGQMSTAQVMFNRPPFDEEIERISNHVIAGRRMISQIPYIKKYDDVINGHHMYFDGSGGYSDGFDRKESEYLPFVDIVSLAVFLEETTNSYYDFEHKSISFEKVIDILKEDKGRRFNENLVDILIGSSRLQLEIKNIVVTNRISVVYDLYHNWEKIQLSQDEESILQDIEDKIDEYRLDSDQDKITPYISKALYLAYNSKKERSRALALFYIMRYYFVAGEYSKALGLETETNRLLESVHLNELLVKNYINCANSEMMRENLEGSMSRYLMALELARITPECIVEENLSLASIANIYAKSSNFKKAVEYFERVNDEDISGYDLMQLFCMEGYCYVKIGDVDKVREIYKKLQHLLVENDEFAEFSSYTYLAFFAYNLGYTKELVKYTDFLNSRYLTEDEFQYRVDEVHLYAELLEELGEIDTLIDYLEYYIGLSNGKKDLSESNIRLISKRIRIETSQIKSKEHARLENLLDSAGYLAVTERAEHMEEMEKTFMENIKLQSEHEDYINEKSVLEQSVIRAKNESEQKSQFLSSMSHEIRTPINAILSLNEMILRECNEDIILQYATDINNAGKQLLGIVNDVLDYSKIEAGKMEITPQKYSIGELVNDIKNMIEPKLSEKNLGYIVKCNNEIPNVLFGDDLRIKQILLNLLSNAYKYTNKGFVQFLIDYNKVDEKTISVHFEVKDTGVGLTEEQIMKLTIPFERFDNASTRGVEGTGLGMSIVSKLLEQMNSKLKVSSVYGEGSVFSFDLIQGVIEWGRLGELEDVKRKVLNSNVERKKTNTGTVVAPEAKILVVDDNAVNLKVIQALLKRNRVQVTTAFSGKECLDLCRTNGYHLIFLDHMMPEMDGLQTLDILKKLGGINKNTPVIALTANVTESGDEFYGKAGFDALLTKPVDFDKLEETLRKYLPSYLIEG